MAISHRIYLLSIAQISETEGKLLVIGPYGPSK